MINTGNMKNIFLSGVLIALLMTGCKSSQKSSTVVPLQTPIQDEQASHFIDFRDASTWILGDMNPDRLYDPPHGEWFMRGFNDFQPDSAAMAEVMKLDTSGLRITVVLGTWCPDSRREVPHFMKIVDIWGFPKARIHMIGVDLDKTAPLGDFSLLGIQRVPTFIFYKNNIEAGRIIETPVTSLEQDMVKILKEK
jgi:thiol-disulfide isomerase/thioredoxin